MKVLAKKIYSIKFITSATTEVKKAFLWLPSPKFHCPISKLGGSAFELLFLKLGYWCRSATLCAEHQWTVEMLKGYRFQTTKNFIRTVTKVFPLTLVDSFQETQLWLKSRQPRNEARS